MRIAAILASALLCALVIQVKLENKAKSIDRPYKESITISDPASLLQSINPFQFVTDNARERDIHVNTWFQRSDEANLRSFLPDSAANFLIMHGDTLRF